MPLSKRLKKHVSSSLSKMKSPVEILLFTSGKYPKVEKEIEQALSEITELDRKLSFKKFKVNSAMAKKENVKKGPVIMLHGKEKGKVRFLGFPSAYEFPVFILDILNVSGVKQHIDKVSEAKAKKIRKKTHIEVFQMPPCAYSPIAVKMAHDIAILNRNVTADMVDALLFPELVRKYKIKETPTTVIDGRTKLYGLMPISEILDALEKRK